jgi:hypothetical protein
MRPTGFRKKKKTMRAIGRVPSALRKKVRLLETEARGSMNPKIIIAVMLIALGIGAFAYQGITYTTREKVVDLGPIHVTAEKTKTIPLPPIVGAIAIVGGIALLVMGRKKG